MRKIMLAGAIVLFLSSQALCGDIYIWTDEKGVKHFSDQPPEGAKNIEKIESDPSGLESDNSVRPEYERMVNEAKQENQASDQQKRDDAVARKAEQQQKEQAEHDAKIKAERDRLQRQIDDLNNRALSTTFSKGMRDNLIDELQKQIDALK